jgi:hypothetical protein
MSKARKDSARTEGKLGPIKYEIRSGKGKPGAVIYDHGGPSARAKNKSFGREVLDSLSGRVGGGGFVLVDDDVAFSSVASNEPKEKLSQILSDFRHAEKRLKH